MKLLSYYIISVVCFLFTSSVFGEVVIGVIGKTKNDSFYQQSYKGCLAFAKQHQDMRCIYDGPQDYQDIRSQAQVINAMAKKGIDGLLISTTDSGFIVSSALAKLQQDNIPVITFDSDLLPEHQQYRLAYVGTNNYDYGIALGEYIKQFADDETNMLCLQSGHQTTPNLNQRIAGIRFALSGQSTKRLTGQKGWSEYVRCPLYSLGKRAKALTQLEAVVTLAEPPIFLAVAGFAQFNPDYIKRMTPFKSMIDKQELIIVSADTEEIQLQALKRGLSVANIGQRPFEMGHLGAELLFRYIQFKERPAKLHYYLDYHYCTQENVEKCTTNF
ncbi:substrate-binding domain-containing protein [Thalassotalea sp. G2M2-11]|uniref:substrate-binding domain-containing protein n=1 Tax=Thalassotalea sp. G2M2-11 TaxID=2787627 RepID=UPI001F49C2A4|nr:substrate-binding domain-containing protein [Thalassotalea sp. G2M2-11]